MLAPWSSDGPCGCRVKTPSEGGSNPRDSNWAHCACSKYNVPGHYISTVVTLRRGSSYHIELTHAWDSSRSGDAFLAADGRLIWGSSGQSGTARNYKRDTTESFTAAGDSVELQFQILDEVLFIDPTYGFNLDDIVVCEDIVL